MVMGENISFEKLTDGEVVALETIEVTSIPHVSTIAEEHETTAEIVSRYQQEFYGLLNEVFQTFRTASLAAGYARDTSLEMLWKTSEVKNQPFKAAIRLFIIMMILSQIVFEKNLIKFLADYGQLLEECTEILAYCSLVCFTYDISFKKK